MVEYEKAYFTGDTYEPYWDFPAHEERVKRLINITHPKSVLDVGCAYGFIVRRLLEGGIHAMGVDISKWCEEKAKTIIPEHFVRTSADDLSMFRDKEFDVLYCEGVLEHIPEDKLAKVMSEFERVSERRYLQMSFSFHKDVEKEYGHVTLKEPWEWFKIVPLYTWIFLGESGTDGGNAWIYKG